MSQGADLPALATPLPPSPHLRLVGDERRCRACGNSDVEFRNDRVGRCVPCEHEDLVRAPLRRPAVDFYEEDELGRVIPHPAPALYAAAVLIARHADAVPLAVLTDRYFPELYRRARHRLLPWFGGDPREYAMLKEAGALVAEALHLPR